MDFHYHDNTTCLSVSAGDQLGVFVKDAPSSLTYDWDFESNSAPLVHAFPGNDFPRIGENVTFDTLFFPFYFSLRADVDIGK